jgi:hypothetical protein
MLFLDVCLVQAIVSHKSVISLTLQARVKVLTILECFLKAGVGHESGSQWSDVVEFLKENHEVKVGPCCIYRKFISMVRQDNEQNNK